MSNVIPLRPDPLRQAYEANDKLNDTKLTPEQQQLVDSIASYLEKAIEESHANRADKIGRGDIHPSA